MGGIIGTVLLILMLFGGFKGDSWMWVLYASPAGVIGYWLMRPHLFMRASQQGVSRVISLFALVFVSQLLTWSIVFYIGRLVGSLVSD